MPSNNNKSSDEQPLSFRFSLRALEASGPSTQDVQVWKIAIIGYLTYCRRLRTVACIATCRSYLREVHPQSPAQVALIRQALLWFVKTGQEVGRTGTPRRFIGDARSVVSGQGAPHVVSTVPPLIPASRDGGDTGEREWERRLVTQIRRRHLLWRNEQTDREWARRFVSFIAPKSPLVADHTKPGGCLSLLTS